MNETGTGVDEKTPAAKNKNGRRRITIKKILVWSFWILLGWWGLSAVVPGVPTPGGAGLAVLSLLKSVSDDVYHLANRRQLERAAHEVRNEAVEPDIAQDRDLASTDKQVEERRRLLPAVSVAEDSALRTQLKAISSAPAIRGRIINILLVGIDSRLSARSARADAVHLFTINPDSAVVEIMSIPRDMYTDLGFPDTTTFNNIANARALGYPGFLGRVQEIAKRGPIRYYVEVGFSQAMGVLEMLGYRDPVSTLRFLRNRQGLAAGDVQRSHNQAVFLRQNLMDRFPLLTGASGDLILTAGLAFVSTNLTKDFCKGLIYALEERKFPKHRYDAVRLRMPSLYRIRLKDMTADSATIAQTNKRLDNIVGEKKAPNINVARYLRRLNSEAAADSNRPGQVIFKLRRLSEQHAWIQIRDRETRIGIRDTMLNLLDRAYRKVGKHSEADKLLELRRAEDVLIQHGDQL